MAQTKKTSLDSLDSFKNRDRAMVLVPLDPNDPQPRRDDPRFGDYKAFRKADKAWSERERNRRKRLKVAEPPEAEVAQPVESLIAEPIAAPPNAPEVASLAADHDAAPSAPLTAPPTAEPLAAGAAPVPASTAPLEPTFRKPHGRVPMAGGEPCQWDASCGCWRDAGGVEWDRLAEKAAAERAARAGLRREQEWQEQEQEAAEAQAKQQQQERDAAECHRLRLEKGERLLQQHVQQGARRRALDTAERRSRLAQLQDSE